MTEHIAFGAELRASISGNSRTITATIPYDSLSHDLGGFREQIAPGAFADALRPGADVLCLRDHDVKTVLGRTKAGTLRFSDGPHGLTYEVKLPDSPSGHDLAESVRRGDVDATSFGFVCAPGGDSWENRPNGFALRTLQKVNLYEVSPCSMAAYGGTKVSLRSAPKSIVALLSSRLRNGNTNLDDDQWREKAHMKVCLAHRRLPFGSVQWRRCERQRLELLLKSR